MPRYLQIPLAPYYTTNRRVAHSLPCFCRWYVISYHISLGIPDSLRIRGIMDAVPYQPLQVTLRRVQHEYEFIKVEAPPLPI